MVAGLLIALVVANIYLYVQVVQLRDDLAETKKSLSAGLVNIKDASSVTLAAQQHHIDTLKEDLEATRRAAASMSAEAAAKENAHAEQLVKQIEAEQAKMQAALGSEISDVKQTSAAGVAAANTKIDNVATDVGTVRSQASQTQEQLSRTIADLKSVTGDLGVQSGLDRHQWQGTGGATPQGRAQLHRHQAGQDQTAAAIRRHRHPSGQRESQKEHVLGVSSWPTTSSPSSRTRVSTSRCSSIP